MKSGKACLALAVGLCGALLAKVEPSALFSDHAVLHRSAETPVFGFADVGEKVSVSLGTAQAGGVADAQGRWLVRLDLRNAGTEPQILKINDYVAKDVLVGEVWLCSGQSNMSFKEGSADDAEEAAKARNPSIRCFVVGGGAVTGLQERIVGRWLVNEPGQTLGMTAVGYQFAKNLQAALKVPVGLVESAVGASTIEAWCDPQTMAENPAANRELKRQIAFMNDYRGYEDRCNAALRAWERKWTREDRPHGDIPVAGWRNLTEKEATSFVHGPGAVWFKRKLTKTPLFARRRFIERQWHFDMSSVEVYWNGTKVACHYPEDPIDKNTELYTLPGGDGELVVRVFNANQMLDVPWTFFAGGKRLDHAGWQISEEYTLPWASKEARADLPKHQRFCLRQHYPTGLYNGMIAGLVPMGLSGVIWYQGESNTTVVEAGSGPQAYEALFTGFIESWRKLFRKPELPFAWCQLASLGTKATDPNCDDLSWVELRAAQQRTLRLPKTGQAILIDAGEDGDIHPRDKRTPGRRLAAWALNQVYGQKVPFRGPHATGVAAEGGKVVVSFSDCGAGLRARDLGTKYVRCSKRNEMGDVKRNSPSAQVEGFSVCGADGRWFWADAAEIVGQTVVVSSKSVPAPVAVRYGWAKNPWVNLYNADGFPAEPFELKVK